MFDLLPKTVEIVEVGPRDGLQNEKKSLSAQDKIDFIDQLSLVGYQRIEAGSFVSPKWVPQMASSDEVIRSIKRADGVRYSALTPNMKGFDVAMQVDIQEVAIFGDASESCAQKNINCSIQELILIKI